jgi:glycosyltransferase involved in cell wall biosynthesis
VIAARHICNKGKGSAIRSALSFVCGEWVIVQDADLEYSSTDYEHLLLCMKSNNALIVYGSRFSNPSVVQLNPKWHTLGNRLLTWFANQVTGQSLTDEATCYKLFRRDVLERMNLQEDGFGFCPEVTAKASRLGIKIHEVPISYNPRTKAEGKKIRLWHGLEALWCLVYYTWFDRSLEPGAPRKPPVPLKEVVRSPAVPAAAEMAATPAQ